MKIDINMGSPPKKTMDSLHFMLKFNNSQMETFDDWKMFAFPFWRSTLCLYFGNYNPNWGRLWQWSKSLPGHTAMIDNPKSHQSQKVCLRIGKGPTHPPNAIFFIPSLKLRNPLKLDGWKTSFLLGWPILCLFSGRVITTRLIRPEQNFLEWKGDIAASAASLSSRSRRLPSSRFSRRILGRKTTRRVTWLGAAR